MAALLEARELTERQAQIFRYLYEFTRDNGYQPSVRDVMAHYGWSGPNAIMTHIRAFRRKGWIQDRTSDGKSVARAIQFLRRTDGSRFYGFAEKPRTEGEFGGIALTERQESIYRFIYNHARDRGFQPDFREIGKHFSIDSTNGVMGHLSALQKKGWTDRPKNSGSNSTGARQIRFLRRPDGSPFTGFADKPAED